ncbi:WASH complex subunit homolog 1-like [Sciurus carolinensis]|uniref:WASH complex subunit homolog 1-like n=1 Tax=Sciurus carolinensis TaxID=30640 RepID=UPI001FB2936B|nr:WASH complex subunit homolog 1-like [Sciurus carolinensis]
MTSPQRAEARGGLSPPRLRLKPRPQYRAQQPPRSWPPSPLPPPPPSPARCSSCPPRAGHAHGHAHSASSRARSSWAFSRCLSAASGCGSGGGSSSGADRSGRRPMAASGRLSSTALTARGAASRLPGGGGGGVRLFSLHQEVA